MAGVAVVTDSTSSLAPGSTTRTGVRVIPLQVVIDGVSRPEADVSPAEVAAALRARRVVSTSRPAAETFRTVYAELAAEGFRGVVSAHLSGRISGTAAAAELAAGEVALPVRVVDTRVIAMAAGFAVLAGAGAARQGGDLADVADAIGRRAAATSTWFSVADLEHLRRGGRIGAATAALGSALAVKPILTVRDGRIRSLERVRTTSRALDRLLELAAGAVSAARVRGEAVEVAVHHLDDEPAARRLAERLEARASLPEPAVVAEVSAVLGVHVGPGTAGVVVSPVV
ncbi:DegV family protein [uncultured Friedmanniella sp.]|uniref:DegV family protein n=1 Tax=uncultured Friedmanniella sp. TaxID=335381 RepID=UPI0035CBFA60